MAISNDLFRAILAMDSYNRGTNASVGGLGGVGSQIGNATVIRQQDGVEAQAISFFAQAYAWNGQTVISYRGSDGLRPAWTSGTVPTDIPYWDIWFANNYGNSQAKFAAEFYQAVKAANPNAVIETTGHSLGGALAGFISGVYGLKGTLFDNIGYMGAVRNLYERSTSGLATYDPLNPGANFVDLVAKGLFYGAGTPSAPNFANISGYWTDGEIATYTRSAAEVALLSKLSIGTGFGNISPIDLHSQAFLVTMMFGNELSNQDWLKISKELTLALFNQSVAREAGASEARVNGEPTGVIEVMESVGELISKHIKAYQLN